MPVSRIAFAFMLIIALAPALSVMPPNVSGQSYVTVTTQATTTALYTYPATTRSVTTTETIYIYEPQDFSVNVCGEPHGIWGDHFSAIQGQRYHVNWTSEANISLNFYITTNFPGALSNSGPNCNNFPASEAIYSYRGATGSVDWVAPSTGQFIYWFLNPSQVPTAGTISIETLNPITFSTVSYGSASTIEPVSLTTIISQTNLNISQIGIPFANLGLLGAVVAIAVVAGVLVLARRRKTSVAATLVHERPPTVQELPRETVASQSVAQTRIVQSPPVSTRVAGPLTPENPIVTPIPETRPAQSEPVATMVVKTHVVVPKPIQSKQLIVSTGYKDLDKALDGGIPQGFAVVVASPSYDERDLLLRKIIESVIANDGSTFYISNDISKTQDLFSRFQSGFFAFSSHAGQIFPQGPNLYKIPGIENLSDANISLGIAIRDAKGKAKDSGKLLLIDILSDVLLKHKAIMTRKWLSDFVSKRKGEGFTIIATLNPLLASKEETESVVDFFDGVIEIHERTLTERARRFLLVKKMYGRRYSENELMLDRDKLLWESQN
jgi:KaiC/GvpD/RAD55 family RecA-like ATPase